MKNTKKISNDYQYIDDILEDENIAKNKNILLNDENLLSNFFDFKKIQKILTQIL